MTRYIYPNLRFKKYAKYGEPVTLAHTRKLFKAALKFCEPVYALFIFKSVLLHDMSDD